MFDDIIPGPQYLAVDFSEELAGLHLKLRIRPNEPAVLFVIGDLVASANIIQNPQTQVNDLMGEMMTVDDDDSGEMEMAISILEYAGVGILEKIKSFGIGDINGNFNYDLTDNFNLEHGYLLEKAAPRDWSV